MDFSFKAETNLFFFSVDFTVVDFFGLSLICFILYAITMHFSNSYHLFTEAINLKFTNACGGELQVKYRGKWEPICPVEKNDADRICRDLKCGNASINLDASIQSGAEVRIQCGNEHNYLRHCFKPAPETCRRKAVIYCDGKCKV